MTTSADGCRASRVGRVAGHPLFCAGLVAAHLGLGITASRRMGVTADEPAHLMVGYLILTRGDYRIDPVHPPLARMILAVPLVLQGVSPPHLRPGDFAVAQFWGTCRRWFHQNNGAHDLLAWPRMVNQCFTAATVVLTWLVLRRRWPLAAAIAAAVVALSPNILAHGGLATTDASVILFYPLSTILFWRCLRGVTMGRLAGACAALAAAVLVKHSGIVACGACVVCAGMKSVLPGSVQWHVAGRRTIASVRGKLLASMTVLLVMGAVCYGAIWACYLFRYSAGPTSPAVVSPSGAGRYLTEGYWPNRQNATHWGQLVIIWARERRLFPEAYLNGFIRVFENARNGVSFIMGLDIIGGSWLYYPIAFMVKTPAAVLVVLLVGTALTLSRLVRGAGWRQTPTVVPAAGVGAILFAVACELSSVNIGFRHFLPAFPLWLIAVTPCLARWVGTAWPRVAFVCALGVCQVGVLAVRWPAYLSFFNLLVGGPNHGYAYIGDSNVDWGQDLPRLAEYLGRRAGPAVKLAYFGSDWPSQYGIEAEQMLTAWQDPHLPWAELEPGTYVASVHVLQTTPPLSRQRKKRYYECQAALAGWREAGKAPPDGLIRHTYEVATPRVLLMLKRRLLAGRISDWVSPSLAVFEVSPRELEEVLPGPRIPVPRRR